YSDAIVGPAEIDRYLAAVFYTCCLETGRFPVAFEKGTFHCTHIIQKNRVVGYYKWRIRQVNQVRNDYVYGELVIQRDRGGSVYIQGYFGRGIGSRSRLRSNSHSGRSNG